MGTFTLISGYSFCNTHKYISDKSNQIIKYQSELVMLIIDKDYRVTFDLVVKIGKLRYGSYHQLEEIQNYLKCSPARIDLPISTIGVVAKRFLTFCKLLHEKYEPMIREEIICNGGFLLHFDATTEKKCGKCALVIMDSRTGHVLDSIMIDGEKYDTIKNALEKIKFKYGHPLATISGLRAGFLKACIDVFGEKVIHIFCHYHFLKTFRDDFLPHHNLIKVYLGQKWKLKRAIEEQIKTLTDIKLKEGFPGVIKSIEDIEIYWADTGDILNTYRYVLKWILMFKQDSSGKGVPFDLPYLDFYHRFIKGKKLINKIFRKAPIQCRLKYYKNGFNNIIAKTKKLKTKKQEFIKTIHHLNYLKKWFNKLRAVLFYGAQRDDLESILAPLSKRYHLTKEEALSIPQRLSDYIEELKGELSKCENSDQENILSRFEKQVEKYQLNLHVPILTINVDGKETKLIPSRTNNCLESFFRLEKSLIRRITGRSKLSKEFASIGDLLPYYMSMQKHKIFKEILNDDRKLQKEFSMLFKKQRVFSENFITIPDISANEVNYDKFQPSKLKSNGVL